MSFNMKSLFQTMHILPLLSAFADAYRPAAAGIGHAFLHRRQAPATSTTPITTYTVITPSLSASPVAVTSLGQIVTSYIPQMTLCAIDSTSSSVPTQWLNNSGSALAKRTATSDCTTSYSTTLLNVCATTLQGLGSTIAITACDQIVTFSSQFGYSLIPASTTTSSFDGTGVAQTTITAPPSINTLTVSVAKPNLSIFLLKPY